ncbi:hypothetical protein K6Q96_06850 [Grimontia kaedaensis]|uniref:Uncharacterized protein n=1 Tax=Grimontia kaedaensis TaxID=2872157 RepID=A0ABY4WXI7_9GAMM|nr:hypothetical protein [Grimontia kaedaensis]USH03705.1 hypothetical protein K6Q96_06850 [Grimontia kaedaensis]
MKNVIILTSMLLSANAWGVEHINLTVDKCRVIPNGDLRVIGNSNGITKTISLQNSTFSKDVMDRYVSLCMAGVVSGKTVRIDYLNCSDSNCTGTGNTSLELFK